MPYDDMNDPMFDDVRDAERFREPGGRSALHPGKRCRPCPTCGRKNALTIRDVQAGYQCDRCADQAERGY